MKYLGVKICHNGPYTNVSTIPYCHSQTIRNIAVQTKPIEYNLSPPNKASFEKELDIDYEKIIK